MPELPDLFDLTGRVAVVTGGAGLLGAEFCWTLAQAGAVVVIADLNGEAAMDLAASLSQSGFHALGIETDVTNADSAQAMVDSSLKNFNRLDILVNSAALDPKFDPQSKKSHSGAFEDYPLELWQQALDVNLTGIFLCSQVAVKPMLDQESGVIINVSSIYGVTAPDQRMYQRKGEPPQFKPVYYTVTKAGVLGMTKYLSAYYAGKGIRVNALTPGGVFNDHNDEFVEAYSARAVIGRMAEKDEMNGAVLFLASEASKYMTGANLIVDGGWTTW
ncbi:MAG: SDR family oxidoreductase [Anaerolineales bacterium]|nr:SDR family oxidoreductase [Chloroflexota bacterium]MBL6979853.1 SDR family oxidoreductase [Anaerolineales bacterium]